MPAPTGFQTGFRCDQASAGGPVFVSNAKSEGSYVSFYYQWLTPEGKPLPANAGGGMRKHTIPPNIAELIPPKGAGVLKLCGPLSRTTFRLK